MRMLVPGWRTAGAVRVKRVGGTDAHMPQVRVAVLSPQLAAGTDSPLTQTEVKTAFGPSDRVNKQTKREHTVSFKPPKRNWCILHRHHSIISGVTVQN